MKRTTSQLIQTILALLFIFVFGNFIPTWSTVTRMGCLLYTSLPLLGSIPDSMRREGGI